MSWISVVLLIATLAVMTMQMSRLNGGHLPQRAPKALPPGVLALDGWAERLPGWSLPRATRFRRIATIWTLPAADFVQKTDE